MSLPPSLKTESPAEARPSPAFSPYLFWSASLLIIGLVALVFGQSWGFGFLEWDDPEYIRNNPQVLAGLTRDTFTWALTSLYMANWHPLTWWSHQLDVSLFGPAPGPMHLVNAALHAANGLLLFRLLLRYRLAWLPALCAAALFVVHPLHVESVAWLSERKDVLSTLFLLLALLAWDRHVRGESRFAYGLALVFTALGLMAKPMLVVMPGLLLILDAWPYRRLRDARQAWWRDARLGQRCLEKLPFALLASVSVVLTLLAQQGGGAIKTLEVVALADRFGNALTAYGLYLLSTLAPISLSYMYVFAPPDPLWVALSALLLGAINVLAWRHGGAVRAGWLWFLFALLPVIGLVAIGDHSRADRYMYIPMVGLLIALAGGPPWARWLRNPALRRGLYLAVGVIVLVYAALAYRYAGVWRDSVSLFEHALRVAPKNHLAHAMLTFTYERRRQFPQALHHADAALTLAPKSVAAANAALSASHAALALGQPALARRYLQRAIEGVPAFSKPHNNLGVMALQAGDWAVAIAHLEKAVALDPGYGEAHNNLGVALLKAGQSARAATAFTEALRLDPGNQQARNNLKMVEGTGLR